MNRTENSIPRVNKLVADDLDDMGEALPDFLRQQIYEKDTANPIIFNTSAPTILEGLISNPDKSLPLEGI